MFRKVNAKEQIIGWYVHIRHPPLISGKECILNLSLSLSLLTLLYVLFIATPCTSVRTLNYFDYVFSVITAEKRTILKWH